MVSPSTKVSVLDHGYIEVIRVEGTDRDIAQSARLSTGSKGDEDKDTRLVQRLIRDEHTSPVEFVGFVFEVQLPLFVARQWMRHRSGVFNEFSGRYSEMMDVFYVPDNERMQAQSTFNKQGSAESLDYETAEHLKALIINHSEDSHRIYKSALDQGLTRELARVVLPVNFYTKYRWRVNLHNLFHFLRLREDPHAQWETRQYANAIHGFCTEYFPIATKAFEDHIQNRITISPTLASVLAGAAEQARSDYTGEYPSEVEEFIRRNYSE